MRINRERATWLLREWTKLFLTATRLVQMERDGELPKQGWHDTRYTAEMLVQARCALVLWEQGIRTRQRVEYVELLMKQTKGDATITLRDHSGASITITMPLAKFRREAAEAIKATGKESMHVGLAQ